MAGPNPSGQFGQQRKLGAAKQHEYSIVDDFSIGYRNKEDVTNTKPGILIIGSKNVLTNTSRRVQIRQGYVLDGATSGTAAAVLASFDWLTRGNNEKHVRAGGLTSAGNDGKLQYRYVDSAGTVTWRDLMTGLTSVSFNFTKFWNKTENNHGGILLGQREMVFVNGDGNVYMWNGAMTTIASTTVNTITKTGTVSWRDTGFYNVANKTMVINGNTYTYSGGEATTTLTGVAGDPTGEANGSIVHQQKVTIALSSFTGYAAPPVGFNPNLISVLNNQIYLASTVSSNIYIGNQNPSTNTTGLITNFDQSSQREANEGAILILDEDIIAFNVQGDQEKETMYFSTYNIWYKNLFTDAVNPIDGTPYQICGAVPIKTGRQQGAQSQANVSSMKNNTITVTNETTIDEIGVIENYFTQIQAKNLSDPIKLDVDNYDFTDGSIAYHRNNIYVAVPKEGLVLIYDLAMKSWEAPQTLPVSRFFVVNGDLYGHSYSTFESYKLFTGYADRVYPTFAGFPIQAVWKFSFENYGSRYAYKKATKMYTEGYINSNTILTCKLIYELDGCQTVKTFQLNGADSQFVCISGAEGSLGKESLGKLKLGGDIVASINDLPPKFRWFPTFSPQDFFESSVEFSVLGTDNRAEIIAFGLAVSGSTQIPVQNQD